MHAVCGIWLMKKDYFIGDLRDTSTKVADDNECLAVCQEDPECNTVTYKLFTNECYLKKQPEGELPVKDIYSKTYKFCPGGPVRMCHFSLLQCQRFIKL
jgi:PAN domain